MWRGAIVVVGLAGCGIEDRPEYVSERARAECDRIETCARGAFESEYSSPEDCVAERADVLDEEADFMDDLDCNFVAEEAGPCVSRVRGMSCEDWIEGEVDQACDLVWNCTDVQQ